MSAELQIGLPAFYEHLIYVLRKNQANVSVSDEREILDTAGVHGREFLRLGYTLSHVVHAYGAICQAITALASSSQAPVTALEFHNLNRCLDIAIAGAVTEFESVRSVEQKSREAENLGAVTHELRNALNRAVISSEMIIKGIVGVGGSTSKVLQYSLTEMARLIDGALADVKLRVDTETYNELFFVAELISQLIVTAEVEAGERGITLTMQIDPELQVQTDRHLLFAAVGNLVQNGMKFTKVRGNVAIVARAEGKSAIIEVTDQCGGIPADKILEMFKPFVQQSKDRSGLGLGLTIARKAVEKCSGQLTVFNTDDGCTFRIVLPRWESTGPVKPPSVV